MSAYADRLYDETHGTPDLTDAEVGARIVALADLDWYASAPMRDVVAALERSGFIVEHGHDVVEVWQESARGDVQVMCVERAVQTHDEALAALWALWACEARGEWAA